MPSLRERYQQVRRVTEMICQPLQTEDYVIQSIIETSPPKWHLAHVSWFFENFLLIPQLSGYHSHHPRFGLLFNSYYETVGSFYPRPKRGLLARPTVKEIYAYRHAIDEAMDTLFNRLEQNPDPKLDFLIELGLNHEQQHQELLCMDIKHNFSINPLKPAYREDLAQPDTGQSHPIKWHHRDHGLYEIGHKSQEFSYDNETPRHKHYLNAFSLADRLVTNAEYLEFINDQGYKRPELWLADAWAHLKQHSWQHPLYWEQQDGEWQQMTLGGLKPLHPNEPVCHISYYEADAYARWAGARLPTEAEMEVVLAEQPMQGNFFDQDILHPAPADKEGQWFGDLWNWTCTSYSAYPGFKPLSGSIGEYNGKFMSNQMVLRGGCCVTSQDHIRASYRNFFYPHDRWQFSGIRLAKEVYTG